MLSMVSADKAAQYSDEWVTSKSGEKKTGHFRAFYACMAGGADHQCGTVILSKAWLRRHEDPLKAKQRWYCLCCGTRYETGFGMLTEFYDGGEHCFALAETPGQDVEDIRALDLEDRVQPCSPENLYEALVDVHPFTCVLTRPAQRHEILPNMNEHGVYKITNLKALAELPKLEWTQLFNFVRT